MNRRVGRHHPVVHLACDLGMPSHARDPVAYVVSYCRRKVDAWVEQFGPRDLRELLDTVLAKVGLIVEEIWDDYDLHATVGRYLSAGEGGFARLVGNTFDAQTYAVVVRLRRPHNGRTHVAVIDCRSPKRARRWFSIWHEVAHLLTNPQLVLDFRRTVRPDKDPMESLMDSVAHEFAFYERFFQFREQPGRGISFKALEAHRTQHAPEASREAAYSTVVSNLVQPVLLVVANLNLKVAERRAAAAGTLVPTLAPQPVLRAVSVIPSRGAEQAGFFLPRNMRVPPDSIIANVFGHQILDLTQRTWISHENLSMWESKGRTQPSFAVVVEAGRCGARVLALITPDSGQRSGFHLVAAPQPA
jgi:hypothetical protein